jgi:aspartyl-tRNA(Asn)/glutamyl-tRNA(Gln) amidotransferase subunit C
MTRPETSAEHFAEPISRQDVRHLAQLARLRLSDQEVEQFTAQLQEILSAASKVREVATADIPPTTHAVQLLNVTRADVLRPCLGRDDVLAAAPAVEDHRFKVPRILDE